jgi:adenylate kinase
VKRRIVLLGPPASGKGTIADRLQTDFGLAIVSPGSLLRAEKTAGSELGMRAHELTRRGELVGDDIINPLVRNWLAGQSGSGFVFDGYPRTLGQAEALDEMLRARGTPLEQVLLLEADPAVLSRRVETRATCAKCGNIVSIGLHVGSIEDRCPRCGGQLTRRSDDTPETLQNRLIEYHVKTEPLVRHYEQKGLLARVNTEPSPDEVFTTVTKILA